MRYSVAATRDVAQFGSALDWGSRGRRFESGRPDIVKGQLSWPFLFISIDVLSAIGHLILPVRSYCLRVGAVQGRIGALTTVATSVACGGMTDVRAGTWCHR